jgi:hypothetical protein
MFADSIKHANSDRQAQPSALRDLRRDWESWSIGERIAIVMIASSTVVLPYLVHWFATV